MRRSLSTEDMEAKSRPAVITLCVLTMRLMENWRFVVTQTKADPADADRTLIVMAVVAIGAEKFTRADLDPALHNLATAMPPGLLNKCNIRSIAAATGINRETVRRKVLELQKSGILEVSDNDGVRVTPRFAAQDQVRQVVQAQVDVIAQAASRLRSLAILK